MSLTPASESLNPNGVEDRPAVDSPPSSVVSPHPDPDPDLPAYAADDAGADATQDSLPLNEQDNDLNMEDASVVPQIDGGPDLDDIPPLHGTPPPSTGADVEMVEEPAHTNGVNGTNGVDAHMSDADANTPHTPNLHLMSSPEASTSYISPKPEDDADHPPPAKRARVHSDADKASLANSASPPPATTDTIMSPTTSAHGISGSHHRFIANCIKTLKKQKDAAPFLRPVDPIALNVPHYPSIIPHPMDFSTIERKVASSNPAKPDSNPSNPRYSDVEEFIADVRLVFQNCYKFNGADHAISAMGRRVEEVFDRQIKNMPTVEAKPVIVKKATPPPVPLPVKKAPPVRRASTSIPAARRTETDTVVRPKREIHPPPPKDLSYPDMPRKGRKSKRVKDDGSAEQLRYCKIIIQELFKKQHYDCASHFYEPVDWVKLGIPSYPKIVKKPMDLSTIRKKLDAGDYAHAAAFQSDFKLMIRNCFTFNPPGTPVNQAGAELQRVFDMKWRQMPDSKPNDPSDDDEDDDGSDDDHTHEDHVREPAALKNAKAAKEKKKKQQEKMAKMAQASTSKPPPKAPKPSKKSSSKPAKKVTADDDSSLSFSQKKDLSEAIQQLDGVKLEKVIKIIHEGFPEIRDSTEEIEIEIDRLPGPVLTKLYNFVIRPTRPPPPKRSRHGKGTGTGGLKRKSMDEDVEAEKIRQLEQRMQLFDNPQNGGSLPPPMPKAADSDSDSSSGSDSSASDSE
ncbi:Bromodomain-containing protein [Mucidula mucida]|nr:Bromodomain-containing protein [Mucidula mucida]